MTRGAAENPRLGGASTSQARGGWTGSRTKESSAMRGASVSLGSRAPSSQPSGALFPSKRLLLTPPPPPPPRGSMPNASARFAASAALTTFSKSPSLLEVPSIAGKRFEPNQYHLGFELSGSYSCFEPVPSTEALWAGDRERGCLDVYSSLTGQLIVSLQPRRLASGVSRHAGRAEPALRQPTALKATLTQMWVGYNDGNVAIFDHLALQPLTEGKFHDQAIVAFCILPDGTIVSGSQDGILVHWDREERQLEALTRVVAGSAGEGSLCCLCAGPTARTALCGFELGAIFSVEVSKGERRAVLRGHRSRVNALLMMEELLFSASEDATVNVWGFGPAEGPEGRLLKRITVQPSARALVADPPTGSLWVAYADGLLERWSAHPDDDFGVEEVVREGMGQGAAEGGPRLDVRALLPITSAETLQILALSSNGVNKVWCSHRSTLEASLMDSVAALHAVILQDTEETAVWRERASLQKQKESERKQKYALLLEQLCEQRLLLQYLDRWLRRRMRRAAPTRPVAQAEELQLRATFRLRRRFFSAWAAFHDRCRRQDRGHALARALAEGHRRTRLAGLLRRWQLGLLERRAAHARRAGAAVMERVGQATLLARYYVRWRQGTPRRRGAADGLPPGLAPDQWRALTNKAQRQLVHQALHRWAGVTAPAPRERRPRALLTFAESLAGLRRERQRRALFHQWHAWVGRRQRFRALRGVASLRAQSVGFGLQQLLFARWKAFVYARHVTRRTAEIAAVEAQLRALEAAHSDIFERLQLQKQIDELLLTQEQEEARHGCSLKELQRLQEERQTITADRAAAAAAAAREHSDSLGGGGGGGLFTFPCNPAWCTQAIEQQQLSPAVLARMPLMEAVTHVMSQFKGSLLNLYTDMPLFRLLKDRRRTGTSARTIFHESFAELKRNVVGSSKPTPRSGGRPPRWPLCYETLDSIPAHLCATLLTAIKTLIISFDLLSGTDLEPVQGIYAEVVANADWMYLLAQACYTRRRPALPAKHRLASSTA